MSKHRLPETAPASLAHNVIYLSCAPCVTLETRELGVSSSLAMDSLDSASAAQTRLKYTYYIIVKYLYKYRVQFYTRTTQRQSGKLNKKKHFAFPCSKCVCARSHKRSAENGRCRFRCCCRCCCWPAHGNGARVPPTSQHDISLGFARACALGVWAWNCPKQTPNNDVGRALPGDRARACAHTYKPTGTVGHKHSYMRCIIKCVSRGITGDVRRRRRTTKIKAIC